MITGRIANLVLRKAGVGKPSNRPLPDSGKKISRPCEFVQFQAVRARFRGIDGFGLGVRGSISPVIPLIPPTMEAYAHDYPDNRLHLPIEAVDS